MVIQQYNIKMNEFHFICYYEFCCKEFNNKYNLKRHINAVHLKIKDFQCEECGKKLVSKVAFKEHSYSHLRVKPLKCPYPNCPLSFSRSSLLCSHKKSHNMKLVVEKESKQYQKRKSLLDLPLIQQSRSDAQLVSKVPLHHQLIS